MQQPFRAGNKKLKKSLLQEIHDTPEFVYPNKVNINTTFTHIKLQSNDIKFD